jgi:hypothetical protein
MNQEKEILLAFAIFMVLAVLAATLRADTGHTSAVEAVLVRSIEKEARNHPIVTDAGYRAAVASAMVRSAEHFDLPVMLIASIAYHESRYRIDNQVGDEGRSVGMMQVGEQGRRACAPVCGDLSTPQEHTDCGACWLDAGRQWCGDLVGGLTAYICGACEPVNTRCRWALTNRLRLAQQFEKVNHEKR